MNVAIIGCGYVGTAVARYWSQGAMVVTATTTTKERVAELEAVAQQIFVVKGDDEVALQAVVQSQDVVLLSVGARKANVYADTYLRTAQTLVKALRQAPKVQQLIYTGSYAVYGDRQGDWVDEESPLAPANQNGEILAETEQVLLSASRNIKVCILRLGGIYGPGRELAKIFSRLAGTTQPGDGKDRTNWVHLDDIVAAIEFARQQKLQGIYNLVNEVPLTRRELLERVYGRDQHQITWDLSGHQVRPYNARVSNQKLLAAGYKFIHPEICA